MATRPVFKTESWRPGPIANQIGGSDINWLVDSVESVGSKTSVKVKGAVGDGTTPCDDAFIEAMDEAFAFAGTWERNVGIHLPAGVYLITNPNVFNRWTNAAYPARAYVTFFGDGMGTTKIVFRPSVPNAWMYDSVANPTKHLMMLTMHDLTIETDPSVVGGPVNLFRLSGVAGWPDQGWTFVNCRFDSHYQHPGTLMKIEGPVNGSEMKFVFCRGYRWKNIIHSTNPQAINHYLIGCDFELCRGDLFWYEGIDGAGGGGQLTLVGGSYIVGEQGFTDNPSLVRIEGATGSVCNLVGVKTEVHDASTILYRIEGVNNFCRIVAHGCDHASGFHPAKLARVNSNCGARLTLRDCNLGQLNLPPGPVFEFVNSTNTPGYYHGTGDSAIVHVEDCDLHTPHVQDLGSWATNAEGGLLRLRRCRAYYPVAHELIPAIAMDADLCGPLGWRAGRGVNPLHVKSISGYVGYWPHVGWGGYITIQVPLGSLIKSIRVNKRAEVGDGGVYQLEVTDGAGVSYGKSIEGTRNDAHFIALEHLNKYVETEDDRIVKLTYAAGKGGGGAYRQQGPGEFFMVEYY